MTEDNMQQELIELKKAVHGLDTKFGELNTEVHVTKHNVNNMKQSQDGFALKIDKMEERLGGKIEALGNTMESRVGRQIDDLYTKFNALTDKFSQLNTQHARGAGFFAGMAAVVTVAGALLLTLAKLLWGNP